MKTVTFTKTGFGQWKVTTEHHGKEISMHFTDAPTYDLIKCEERGYKNAIKRLRSRIIDNNRQYTN
jgi:hypothetical protein